MHASALLYTLALLHGAMASPVAEPIGPEPAPEVQARSVERRVPSAYDIPFPKFPSRNYGGSSGKSSGKDCPSSSSVTQSNACSAGAPYCCTSDGKGGQVCQNTTACTQTVICCNNNNGFQICIGDLDFNVPITINVYE